MFNYFFFLDIFLVLATMYILHLAIDDDDDDDDDGVDKKRKEKKEKL